MIFFAAIPVLIFLGLLGLFAWCRVNDDRLKKQSGPYYNHPDKDLPLYNKGHCDRYSVGTFYW